MFLALILNIDENVIKVHYHKNVELFCQDLVDVTLKRGQCISQFERRDLVLKVVITGPEGRLLFIAFSDPHLIVGIGQVKLGETSSPA